MVPQFPQLSVLDVVFVQKKLQHVSPPRHYSSEAMSVNPG